MEAPHLLPFNSCSDGGVYGFLLSVLLIDFKDVTTHGFGNCFFLSIHLVFFFVR